MGLFDFFRKKAAPATPEISLERISYDIAYFVLPEYVFKKLDHIVELCSTQPMAAGPYYYVMACQVRGIEPVKETALRYRWHQGVFEGQIKYLALEYPTPPPMSLGNRDPLELLQSGQMPVLAPYFSVILHGGVAEPEYFILGQSPMEGVNTVRRILAAGENCNCGPGPEPELAKFLDAIRDRRKA